MIKKGISLAMAAGTLIVYLQSQLQSNDALFLFISSNLLVNIGLVGLASAAVWLSFQTEFKTARTYIGAAAAAVALSFIGIIGILSASLDKYMFDVIKPLDYVLFLEAGIIFSICSLSYKHPAVKLSLPSLRLPVMARVKQLAGGLPNLSDTPGRSRPRAA
jgi:hypothetical protein